MSDALQVRVIPDGDRGTVHVEDRFDTDIGVAALFDWVGYSAVGHELSHQNGGCGCERRGSGPRSSIVPPQSGQTSSWWPVSRRVRSR